MTDPLGPEEARADAASGETTDTAPSTRAPGAGMEWVGSWRCTCGVWCEEWIDRERYGWRVRHGAGEAVFTISVDEILDSMGEESSPWQRWLDRVHEYERAA